MVGYTLSLSPSLIGFMRHLDFFDFILLV